MFLRLVLLFTLVPLVELFLLVEIGRAMGVGVTIVLVVGTGVLGAWLARLQGVRTVRVLKEELARGQMPAAALVDGALILAAGAVLLTPGLLTDGLGFFLLIPAGRAAVRRAALRAIERRLHPQDGTVIDAQWRRED